MSRRQSGVGAVRKHDGRQPHRNAATLGSPPRSRSGRRARANTTSLENRREIAQHRQVVHGETRDELTDDGCRDLRHRQVGAAPTGSGRRRRELGDDVVVAAVGRQRQGHRDRADGVAAGEQVMLRPPPRRVEEVVRADQQRGARRRGTRRSRPRHPPRSSRAASRTGSRACRPRRSPGSDRRARRAGCTARRPSHAVIGEQLVDSGRPAGADAGREVLRPAASGVGDVHDLEVVARGARASAGAARPRPGPRRRSRHRAASCFLPMVLHEAYLSLCGT